MAFVIRPGASAPETVKNLGWLLRHAADVTAIRVRRFTAAEREAVNGPFGHRDAELIAWLADGTIYKTHFASANVAHSGSAPQSAPRDDRAVLRRHSHRRVLNMNGQLTWYREGSGVAFVRLPPELRAPIPSGCTCTHCKRLTEADPKYVPTWDTVAVPLAPREGRKTSTTYTVHCPEGH
jgi:hypothetical protein